MKNINEIVEQLISGNADIKELCTKLEEGMEYFEENYEGHLDSKKLSILIDKSRSDQNLQFILTSLLYCSNKESITDEVFNKILKFRKGLRRTYLLALAHCDISFYQLMAINKMKSCSEAFGGLMNRMYSELT